MYYLGGSVIAEYKISTFMYDSVLKGRFVFLCSCSLYSHPDYRYLHWADCGRLIIEKSIKKHRENNNNNNNPHEKMND